MLSPKYQKSKYGAFYNVLRLHKWISMVTYAWNWYARMRFDLSWGLLSMVRYASMSFNQFWGLWWSLALEVGQKYAKNSSLAPTLIPKYLIWCLNIMPRDPQWLFYVFFHCPARLHVRPTGFVSCRSQWTTGFQISIVYHIQKTGTKCVWLAWSPDCRTSCPALAKYLLQTLKYVSTNGMKVLCDRNATHWNSSNLFIPKYKGCLQN